MKTIFALLMSVACLIAFADQSRAGGAAVAVGGNHAFVGAGFHGGFGHVGHVGFNHGFVGHGFNNAFLFRQNAFFTPAFSSFAAVDSCGVGAAFVPGFNAGFGYNAGVGCGAAGFVGGSTTVINRTTVRFRRF